MQNLIYQGVDEDSLFVIQAQLASISKLISQQAQHGSPFQSQGQGASSFNYQEQKSSSAFEEIVIALLEVAKKRHDAQDTRLSKVEADVTRLSTSVKNIET